MARDRANDNEWLGTGQRQWWLGTGPRKCKIIWLRTWNIWALSNDQTSNLSFSLVESLTQIWIFFFGGGSYGFGLFTDKFSMFLEHGREDVHRCIRRQAFSLCFAMGEGDECKEKILWGTGTFKGAVSYAVKALGTSIMIILVIFIII